MTHWVLSQALNIYDITFYGDWQKLKQKANVQNAETHGKLE